MSDVANAGNLVAQARQEGRLEGLREAISEIEQRVEDFTTWRDSHQRHGDTVRASVYNHACATMRATIAAIEALVAAEAGDTP